MYNTHVCFHLIDSLDRTLLATTPSLVRIADTRQMDTLLLTEVTFTDSTNTSTRSIDSSDILLRLTKKDNWTGKFVLIVLKI